ncbi:hypothetical protein FB451DRAFT_1208318 [Mycena latifolia]|nr:hypothetical protein FB451DRAFT_1208318 [Mycena latifolia]
MYEDVAKAIREHPAIDTLSVLSMMQCADLIPNGSAKPYNIELNYCHGNSTALLLRPKTVKFLRLHNYDRQGNWPSDIWDSLQHVDPRPEHMDAICSSLQRYLELGRRPALKSLDLSEFRAQKILPMLAVFRGLDLDAFAYVPYQEYLYDVDLLTEILDVVPKVRTLSITNPKGYSAKHRKKEIQIDPDVVGLLSNLPNLERLTLTFERPYYLADSLEDPEDASDLGQPAVGVLSEACPLLRRVRLVLGWSEMDVCLDEPAIVEYLIRRKGPRREVVVERVAPRLLEGTILEFVQWR